MKVLLTGGLGYLGGRLAQALESMTDNEVTLATRRIATSPTVSAKTIRVDWASDVELERACQGADTVVHLAGMNSADCAGDPGAALEINGIGTARLVRAATLQRVARFIYLSTAHVYGAALNGIVEEDTCLESHHPYATSHRAGEDAVRMAHQAGEIQGIVVRLSNSFGAPVHADARCWALVVNDLCQQAVIARRAVLRSSGGQRRDFIAISEACRAIVHLMTVPASKLGNGVFNVGSGWAPTLSEMADLIATRVESVLGFRPAVERGTLGGRMDSDRLHYSVAKLLSTGFKFSGTATIEELDRLVVFCAQRLTSVKS